MKARCHGDGHRGRCVGRSITAAWFGFSIARAAVACPAAEDDISTDRPSVANSSTVVPLNSLQSENGVDLTRRSGSTAINATNSRLRLGVGECLELLVDLPSYTHGFSGGTTNGFSDVAPAIKQQLGPLPGDIDLSVALGAALPSGTDVSGPGYQPYLQFPWSHAIAEGWAIAGMVAGSWLPRQPESQRALQATWVLQHTVGEHGGVFAEFVGNYPSAGGPERFLNFGGTYVLTHAQQIDIHSGFGLDPSATHAFVGIGYSWRWDHVR